MCLVAEGLAAYITEVLGIKPGRVSVRTIPSPYWGIDKPEPLGVWIDDVMLPPHIHHEGVGDQMDELAQLLIQSVATLSIVMPAIESKQVVGYKIFPVAIQYHPVWDEWHVRMDASPSGCSGAVFAIALADMEEMVESDGFDNISISGNYPTDECGNWFGLNPLLGARYTDRGRG